MNKDLIKMNKEIMNGIESIIEEVKNIDKNIILEVKEIEKKNNKEYIKRK